MIVILDGAHAYHPEMSSLRVVRHVVEVENRDDTVSRGFHVIKHPADGWVIAQVFDNQGRNLPLPGVSRMWEQDPTQNTVFIPTVAKEYYPVTVVIVG